jgi:CRP/FNR family cyclic AMP-dependent transcriptional regulator
VTDAASLLRETELFARIDGRAAEELAKRLVPRAFRRGQPLFHQGDRGDALYVIVEGSVAVVVTNENGDRMVLTTLHPPDVVGELSLLDGGSRSATAEAVEDTATLVLARAAFLDLLKDHPPLVDALLRAFGSLVRRLSEQASDFVFLDLPGRLAKVLLRLADDNGGGGAVEVAVTQGRLAEMVGGSRQSVNQILQTFQQRGLLEVHARRVVICRPDQLRHRAGLA